MCIQVTKTANRFEISSLLETILLKQVRWFLTFVGLYILVFVKLLHNYVRYIFQMDYLKTGVMYV